MATYKGLDVINAIFDKSTVTLSNAVKNAYAAKVQAVIDASTNSATLDASVVSKLLKLSLVRNEMVKSFDSNATNKLDTVTELNSAKASLGQVLTDLINAANYTNKVVSSGFADDAGLGAFSYQVPASGDIQPAATIANFGTNDQLNFGITPLSDISFDAGTLGDGNMSVLVINDNATIELTLTGIDAGFDKAGQSVTSFKEFFGSYSIVNGSSTTSSGTAGSTNTINVTSTSSNTLTAAADTINFSAGTYTATLANFAIGDKLNLPDTFLSTVTLTNTSGSDGQITLQADDGTNVIDIVLTGIPAATDATIYNMSTFYAAFGSGSII